MLQRVDSSNYDPWMAWSLGIQIAAINLQTPGPAIWVNHGLFQDNGGVGFIKKPNWMLGSTIPNPEDIPATTIVKLHVMSARNMLHKSVRNNCILVEVYGLTQVLAKHKYSYRLLFVFVIIIFLCRICNQSARGLCERSISVPGMNRLNLRSDVRKSPLYCYPLLMSSLCESNFLSKL
jgi:hypothetical protein